MGVEYYQYCIVGLSFSEDEVKTILQPKETELQNRYDTRTGKVIKQERVVIKEEISEYNLAGYKSTCPYDLANQIDRDDEHLSCWFIDDVFYIGIQLTAANPHGRVELLEDVISLKEIMEKFDKANEFLVNPQLIFFSHIG